MISHDGYYCKNCGHFYKNHNNIYGKFCTHCLYYNEPDSQKPMNILRLRAEKNKLTILEYLQRKYNGDNNANQSR